MPNSLTSVTTNIIDAINRPLGFYVLALLIVEVFLTNVITHGNLESPVQAQGMWAGVGLFVFVVGVVTIICWFKPTNLTFSELGSLVEMGKAAYGTNAVEVPLKDMPKGEQSTKQEED